ncbi:MAG TPA: SurA N-terminal domain-containing protein [Pyrinomonadaceae bacterium]|nr:SurA N-terminal domain-containing protein [Pyrinomonadaceae bacterium]
MLKQLSRLERTRSIVIIGFAVLMAVSLVFFYAPGRNANVEPTKSTQVVAEVGNEEITVGDLARETANFQQMYGGQISLAQLGGTKRFLDGLIRNRVVAQEAARMGFSASDGEVAERIRKQFSDPSGKVDIERYKESVTARYGDVEKYEQDVRNDIAQEKLRAFVTASVRVSDEEVQSDFQRENTSFDLSYAVIAPDKLAEKIQASDDELKSYYDQHKTDFRILEPQKKIRYVFIDQAKSGAKASISDNDLRAAFDKLPAPNKSAGVKVQQIVLKVARKDLDAQVEQKAKDLLAKAMAAKPEESEKVFADLARGNSEDPATAKNGGFLPRPVKKNPNKIDALYDRAVDMEEGVVFDVPIKYANNWYLMRRGAAVEKTFEEARPELMASQRNTAGYTAARQIAERAKARLKETKDPQKVAQELAKDANMQPGEMVKETPFVKPGDDVPGIGSSQQFEAVIEPLNNPGDTGEQTGVKGGFAVPMLVEKREPRIPDFDEVKTDVAKAVKVQRAKEQLDQKAREIASSLNSAADLKAAAEQAGFEVATQEGYKLGSPLGNAGTSPALDEAIYALKTGEVTKTAIKVGDNWVVLGVVKREEADLAEFSTKRDQLTQQALRTRQSQVFEDYIGAVQERMKQAGDITIHQDVLTAMEAAEPAVAPGRPQFPQFPLPAQ